MRRTVRLETNNPAVLKLTNKFFERYQYREPGPVEFIWRLVSEPDSNLDSTAVQLSAFSDAGVRYVNFGQRSFLAVDLESRMATGFLAPVFLDGDARLRHRPPLDILFCMTAASLGLTALSGGCVGIQDRAVMIFGPPNSGKTTSSYLAARMGMEFHADQVVFLDLRAGSLRTWGDPFPAVFRPETLGFLPELKEATHLSTYSDLSFYYFDKSALQPQWATPVMPISNVFLDRGRECQPELRRLSATETASRLRDCMLFEEDARFDAQVLTALTDLSTRPSYNLRYGSNPMIAATLIEKMLR